MGARCPCHRHVRLLSFPPNTNADSRARLTKQYEGGLLKCGNYWEDQTYGPLKLQLVSTEGGEDAVDSTGTTGFNFGSHPEAGAEAKEETDNIKRVFLLRHEGQSSEPPRKIVQIQCVTWPDFDVPDSPEILLNLIKDVDTAMEDVPCESEADDGDDSRKTKPPVLVHCGSTSLSLKIALTIMQALRELVGPVASSLSTPFLTDFDERRRPPRLLPQRTTPSPDRPRKLLHRLDPKLRRS